MENMILYILGEIIYVLLDLMSLFTQTLLHLHAGL